MYSKDASHNTGTECVLLSFHLNVFYKFSFESISAIVPLTPYGNCRSLHCYK